MSAEPSSKVVGYLIAALAVLMGLFFLALSIGVFYKGPALGGLIVFAIAALCFFVSYRLIKKPQFTKSQFETDLQAGEFETREYIEKIPFSFVTLGLAAVNVLIFCGLALLKITPMSPSTDELLNGGALFGPKVASGEYWRVFTAMFIHIGFFHLLLNVIGLFQLGRIMDFYLGKTKLLILYIVCGLAGNLTVLLFSPDKIVAGASGAVFGLLGGFAAILVFKFYSLPPLVLKGLRFSAGTLIIVNMVFSLQPGISFGAHAGGLIMGFIFITLAERFSHRSEHLNHTNK